MPFDLAGEDPSRWSQVYNLYADKLLGTKLIDDMVGLIGDRDSRKGSLMNPTSRFIKTKHNFTMISSRTLVIFYTSDPSMQVALINYFTFSAGGLPLDSTSSVANIGESILCETSGSGT